ncbi:MAG: DUF805 domain-containing protein [Defluviitaleaceae bacterium]|nr:DUF805 domain-containing protein [Defluviitaleaceae bacterium]
MKWFFIVLKKYAVFTGRARRKEFWMFTLFCIILGVVLMILDRIFGTTFNLDKESTGDYLFSIFVGGGWLDSIFNLAVFVPGLAVSFRRLHDIGKSGWWNLLAFVPIIGWIILLVWNCRDSQPDENKYGVNPK